MDTGGRITIKSQRVTIAGMLKKSLIRLLILSLPAFISIFCNSGESTGSEFSLKPSITLREEYDDNIYLKSNNKTDDYITRVMPSLKIDYSTPWITWDSDYSLNWWYYAKRNESDASHSLLLSSKAMIVRNLVYLSVSDIYKNVVLEFRDPSTESNLSENRSDENTFSVSPYISYRLGDKGSFSTGYRYSNIWYSKKEGRDREVHTGYATTEYSFSSRSSLSLGGEYTADRPRNEIETDWNNNKTSIYTKAVLSIGQRTTLDVLAGYQWIKYSNQEFTYYSWPIIIKKVYRSKKEESSYYSAGVSYKFSESGRADLRAQSLFSTSPRYGVMKTRTEQLSVKFGNLISFKGTVFNRLETYSETNRSDETVGGKITLEYKPDPRVSLTLSGRHEEDKFSGTASLYPLGEKRTNDSGTAGVGYNLSSKTSFSASYSCNKVDYLKSGDYTNSVVMMQMTTRL
jgi:predicted porin